MNAVWYPRRVSFRVWASIVAVQGIALSAHAQSLGHQLGSPSGGAPQVRPAVEIEPAPPPPEPVVHGVPPPPVPIVVGAPAPGTPPDLVLLHDGGMLRGTIVQSQPCVRVVVQLTTGEVREIAWDEVRFAGRSDDAPRTTMPVVMPRSVEPETDGLLRVRFEADLRMTLHRLEATAQSQATVGFMSVRGRSDLYMRECTAPCELAVDPGIHSFALAVGAGQPIPMRAVDITRGGTLRGIHVDNAGIRAAGGATFAVGLVLAAVMIPVSLFVNPYWVDLPLLIAGSVTGGIGLIVGIPMMAMRSGVLLRYE